MSDKSPATLHKSSSDTTRPLLWLSGMHSWYTDPGSRGQAPFFLRYTLIAYISPVLDDMRNVETYVAKDAPEIDYTFVLPPGLSNKPLTGGLLKKYIFA